ncbi:flavin reductase family protein [Pseudomonas sp. S2_A02]
MQLDNKKTPEVDLRKFAGQFAAGVSVISTADDEGLCAGITMTAVMSLSLTPPLFLVSLDNNSKTLTAILDNGHFCINFLSKDQSTVSQLFSSKSDDKFDNVSFYKGITGSPCLEGALAHGECEVHESYSGGDHTIIIGRVINTAINGGEPLVYHSGKYATLEHQ